MTRSLVMRHIMLVILVLVNASCSGQSKSENAKTLLADSTPQDPEKVRKSLIELGDSAVDPILEAVAREGNAAPMRLALIVSVLSSIKTTKSDRALGNLLADNRPAVRAYAASALGRNRVSCATPLLIARLTDSEQYGSKVMTDPHREVPLTVADAVLGGLEEITSQRSSSENPSDQAQAFSKWWDTNRSKFVCTNW